MGLKVFMLLCLGDHEGVQTAEFSPSTQPNLPQETSDRGGWDIDGL